MNVLLVIIVPRVVSKRLRYYVLLAITVKMEQSTQAHVQMAPFQIRQDLQLLENVRSVLQDTSVMEMAWLKWQGTVNKVIAAKVIFYSLIHHFCGQMYKLYKYSTIFNIPLLLYTLLVKVTKFLLSGIFLLFFILWY